MSHEAPFGREEAEVMFRRLIAGWASHLDDTGARIYLEGVTASYDEGGSYEGVTRMFWALGGWLSRPERPETIEWAGQSWNLLEIMRRAILNGTDPENRGYWGVPRTDRLQLVESGHVAFALWQTRERLWNHLTPDQHQQIARWFAASSAAPEHYPNNFAMFWLLNHTGRQALGQEYDPAVIPGVLSYMDEVYCGDGWYDDGATRGVDHFDDYTLWVFTSHFLCWAQMAPEEYAGEIREKSERVQQLMQHVPFFYGADGAYSHFGRSLSYKFARLGAPLLAQFHGLWPHPPGMLRRMVGQQLRWHFDRGVLRGDNTLRQSLTSEGSVEIRETYGSTGTVYWAMQAFAGLWALADNDPFWTDDEVPLPVEQGDFVKILPEPGWVLSGSKSTGNVTRFSAKSSKMPAKYGKFHYSTLAPFNVGLVDGAPSPDGMLCLMDNGELGHRDTTLLAKIGEPGWLRMRYEQAVNNRTHTIETVIVVDGDYHLRLHRIHLAPGSTGVSAIEGAAPLGFPPGGLITSSQSGDPIRSQASHAGRVVSIQGHEGYDRAGYPSAWKNNETLNSVYGKYVLPHLLVDHIHPEHTLVSTVELTMQPVSPVPADQAPPIAWNDDDSVTVSWRRFQNLNIPALD